MFISNQPERIQDLVSDFNNDLMVINQKNNQQISKGILLGDLFVQAENKEIAKNWLTKTYWQFLLDTIVFFDYFPDNLKKYLQRFFLNEHAIGMRGITLNFNTFNITNMLEVFRLIENAQSEIAASIFLELNRYHNDQLRTGEGILASSNVIKIPIKKIAQSNLIVAKKRLKLLVLKIIFIINFVVGYKFDVQNFFLLNKKISEHDLLINPLTKVNQFLEKRMDLEGNISLIVDKNCADLIRTKLMVLEEISQTKQMSESLLFSNFFGIESTYYQREKIEHSMLSGQPTYKRNTSLFEFACMTNKQRKKELKKNGGK